MCTKISCPCFVTFYLIRYHQQSFSYKGRVFLGLTSTKLGLMCLAQGHNAVTPVMLEPAAPRSRVKHSTTEPLRSLSCHGPTVNSEIFARANFRETSHMRSFLRIEPSRNGGITMSFTDEGKSCPSRDFLTPLLCLDGFREKKISEFTVVTILPLFFV